MDPNSYYHVYTHANGNENLFRSKENYRFFLKRYNHFISPIADTMAYCLMPNHLHLLIQIKSENSLEQLLGKPDINKSLSNCISKQFANLFSSYTQSYNKVYKRKGSLFIPNFKKKEILSDSYLTRIIYYIHANPVTHGFTKDINSWYWSSHHAYLSDKPTLLKRSLVWEWFGGKEQYAAFHEQQDLPTSFPKV